MEVVIETVVARIEAARRQNGVSLDELWWRFFSLGGDLPQDAFQKALQSDERVAASDQDILVHALHELLAEGGKDVVVLAGEDEDGAGAELAAPTVDDVLLVVAMSRLPRRLLNASSSLEPDDLATLVQRELRGCGVEDAAIHLVDYEQGVLVPVPPASGSAIDVDGTLAGRAFQSERPVAGRNEQSGWTLWLPLLDGAERLGVLQLSTSFLSDDVLREATGIAAAVAELVVSKMRYGDALGLVRRTARMTLSAEMRWSVLPPLTFAGDRVGIACVLEPAYDVAGDAFDYSVNAGMLHLAIFDAMGHGLEATRMANLALGAYRFSRRRGFDLANSYRAIDDAIATQFGDEHYVTGQLVTLDLATGLLRWLCAGHPPALVLRRGRLAAQLSAEPCLPLGLGHDPLAPAESSLEPGDHLLFFTDGVPEARSPGGERFGEERLIDLTIRALSDQQTLAETVRRLVRSVQAHREGPLGDDATVLLVAWNGVASLASS